MDDLDFIADPTLRKKVEDSIEYIYLLFEELKKREGNDLYHEETRRVIVLYTVATIEAVLLYLYKKHGEEITYLDYKFVQALSEKYKHESDRVATVVVATQNRKKKEDSQINLADLLEYFSSRKLMTKETGEKILAINNLRNTLHLNKVRDAIKCDITQVEVALNLLLHVIQKAPKTVLKTR
ncbi:MAG: hypothetical protein Q8P93_00395 [bacterium]|nr:hypothetical protein [bacterium]